MCGDGCSPHLPEVSRHYVIVVKCFASGQCSLQTGDPEVIFKHHTCCKDYGVRYDPLYWEITALILAATCIPLFHKFTSKWIASGTPTVLQNCYLSFQPFPRPYFIHEDIKRPEQCWARHFFQFARHYFQFAPPRRAPPFKSLLHLTTADRGVFQLN